MARRIASISPLILAAAAFVQLAGLVLAQYLVGINITELWHHWLLQLVTGC